MRCELVAQLSEQGQGTRVAEAEMVQPLGRGSFGQSSPLFCWEEWAGIVAPLLSLLRCPRRAMWPQLELRREEPCTVLRLRIEGRGAGCPAPLGCPCGCAVVAVSRLVPEDFTLLDLLVTRLGAFCEE